MAVTRTQQLSSYQRRAVCMCIRVIITTMVTAAINIKRTKNTNCTTMKAFPNLFPREETATSEQVLEEHLYHFTSQCRQWNLWEGGSVCVCVCVCVCVYIM